MMQGNANDELESTDIYGKRYVVHTNELQWRPAAYAIATKDRSILLVKQNGTFHLPGGGVDLGENPNAAVLRELTEESGLHATNPVLVDVISTFFTFETYDTHELHHVQSLLFYFACELTGEKPQPFNLDAYEKLYGHEVAWLKLEDLDSIVIGTSVDWRPIVKKAITQQGNG